MLERPKAGLNLFPHPFIIISVSEHIKSSVELNLLKAEFLMFSNSPCNYPVTLTVYNIKSGWIKMNKNPYKHVEVLKIFKKKLKLKVMFPFI